MITFAIIDKNRCEFPDMEKFVLPILYKEHTEPERVKLKSSIDEYIWSVIGPYVKFREVEVSDIMENMCKELMEYFPGRKFDDFFYHTKASYSFPKKCMELFYCQPLWNSYEKDATGDINNIGCLMSLDHTIIENRCIILGNSYDLSAPKMVKLTSVTKDDIIKMIKRRYFQTAILIKKDRFVKYYYQNPLYLVMKVYNLTPEDKIERLSFSNLKYNFKLLFQHDNTKYVNESATRINGFYILYGDILLFHEIEENIYANISMSEIKKINALSYGRLYDRQLKQDEIHSTIKIDVDENGKEIEKKVTPFWSRYIIVLKRLELYKKIMNKCFNCHKDMKNVIKCNRCFRVKFCCHNCKEEYANDHYDDCINPQI